jgi:sugar phosphate isomerase/epimerase
MARIGVQLMMLKEQVEQDGPYETLRRLKEIGFSSVEVSQIPMTPENVAQMVRAREELGTEFAALSAVLDTPFGMPGEALNTDFDKIVADTKALGSTKLRIGMMPFDAMASTEALIAFCHAADAMALRLAGEGIGLYYHNHHLEFGKLDGEIMLDVIRREAPNLRFEIDVHWVQRGGKDPVRTLQRYAGLVDLVHLKDYRVGQLAPDAFGFLSKGDVAGFMGAFTNVIEFGEVGEGNLEWTEIIETAISSGAQHLLIEQDQQYGRSPWECLQTSYDNLVALGFERLM